LDFIESKLACNACKLEFNWVAAKFNCTKGVPEGVDTAVEHIVMKPERFVISWFNKDIVWLPNNNGSVAFLEPKYTFSDWITVDGVSILTLYTAFKFIDLLELNNIWSSFELNTNLPELTIICFPLYWFGIVGGLVL